MSKETLEYRKQLKASELSIVNSLKDYQLVHQLYLRELEKEDRDEDKINALCIRNIATLTKAEQIIAEIRDKLLYGFAK
jgi:hypothetical protein